ncbi:fasciclin-3 isoform X5 [Pseudomyrmex gracilis]|uniref:fasciclin-3 isoform X5 n=1 Tax=Pseudomyrmex gracilis TaxID=219809 RepID=UPI000994B5EE|nr:fasciclin-3 isoform X5 [Pseudomyrmex gracilis]
MCMEATSGRIKMTNTWVCVFAVLCAMIVKGASITVDIDPKRETAVRVGETLQILCKISRPLRVCRVEIPGESNAMVLSPDDAPSEDGIRYYGNGIRAGECGVSIAKVKETYDGIFKCSLTASDSRQEETASLKIIVAKPPKKPLLYTNHGFSNQNPTFRNGEKVEITCSASDGRPAANVTLFLDDEPIGYDVYEANMKDNSLAIQNASRSLDWKDNGKMLRCVANHIALDKPLESTLELNVEYPPQPENTFQRFGYVIGRQGIINVTINANPRPSFTWRVNNERIQEGRPDESGRLETSTAVDMGRGAWSAILTIDSVQKSDTEKEYVLEANNNLGAHEYRIVLSTSSEPAGVDLDAGSIIGIVVGVLVLVLVIFLVIFARATGRWCFAGRSSTRNLGESSDTESAGRYSRSEIDGSSSRGQRKPRINLSRLFGRNKDKVSGADTDTMKTVVTVDDEKLQATEPAVLAQESRLNPSKSEGGIVYAELDLQQQQGAPPRRLNDEKTEYAEILYTKPETEETADK